MNTLLQFLKPFVGRINASVSPIKAEVPAPINIVSESFEI